MNHATALMLLPQLLREDQENIRAFREGKLTSEKWAEAQKIRLGKLREILDCFFPTKKDFGEEGYKSAFVLVLHSQDVPLMKQYLALHQKEDSRNVERSSEAFLIDKILIQTGEKQRYGTQFKHKEDRTIEFLPIEDEQRVNELRAAIGLPTLEEYRKYAETP
jgi:hypothetical protein